MVWVLFDRNILIPRFLQSTLKLEVREASVSAELEVVDSGILLAVAAASGILLPDATAWLLLPDAAAWLLLLLTWHESFKLSDPESVSGLNIFHLK